ncbi:unnamed protein product [Heterotrigona itama]|uniref:Reverse transcriptase domain-containing protein n=1 Tax=Heterotrigona itama TaxID=395501 RepID=A0A6V7H301_9HYME|nr:unnamed protein product [Heterotrigona itama]
METTRRLTRMLRFQPLFTTHVFAWAYSSRMKKSLVLLHQKGSQNDLSNWGPIAMGDVVVAVLADHLMCWATANNRLYAAQKGFLPHEGYLKHSFMLHCVIERARDLKKQVVVAWLDLADAFDSVSHVVIRHALVDAVMPIRVVDIVESLYEGRGGTHPPTWGGCGLSPLADLADVTVVADAFKVMHALDTAIARVARSTLENTVRSKIRRTPNEEDIAKYLSDSRERELSLSSSSRVLFCSRERLLRSAALKSAHRFWFRWRWDSARCELSLDGKSLAVLGLPWPNTTCQRLSRSRTRERAIASCGRISTCALPTGALCIARALCIDVLPLNGSRRWGDGDRRSGKCGYQFEILSHVLCSSHATARKLRHNAIVEWLAAAVRIPVVVRVYQCVPGVDRDLAALRSDIVVTHEPSRTVVIIYVTALFKNKLEALERARLEKIQKRQPLADALVTSDHVVYVDGIVVGALDAWHPHNDRLFLMRKLKVSVKIAWSRDIYVEHSGIRQYSVPGPAAKDAAPFDSSSATINVSEAIAAQIT